MAGSYCCKNGSYCGYGFVREYMERAAELARLSAAEGEVPVGCVIARKSDGRIIGEGRNRREKSRSPIAHAEIEAISEASRFLGGWRLHGCEMYVTLEPCPMCAGAIINSRLDKVVFGAYDEKNGAMGSVTDLSALGFSHRPICEGGFMREECAALLKDFFGEMRNRKMDPIKLVKAQSDDQMKRIAAIADEIWHEYFPCIISEEQIDYMLEKFCSFKAVKNNAENDCYEYFFIKRNGADIGYTAVKPDGDRLFLSKIYLKKEERGKKYSRKVMEYHINYCREHNLKAIWLTVNKHNDTAIAAYRAMGFEVIGEGAADIGNGFVMDDYYMQLNV